MDLVNFPVEHSILCLKICSLYLKILLLFFYLLNNFQSTELQCHYTIRVKDQISGHLSGFINNFMELGTFHKILKIGKVSPLFKIGDSQLFENYRPISVLPIFGKIFEKVLYNRLYSFFMSKNVIYNKQFGFRKNTLLAMPLTIL